MQWLSMPSSAMQLHIPCCIFPGISTTKLLISYGGSFHFQLGTLLLSVLQSFAPPAVLLKGFFGCCQVWYGVPAHASSALEDAMKDALPDLFEAAPDLMYSLVTMVSPTNLQVSSTHPAPCQASPSFCTCHS